MVDLTSLQSEDDIRTKVVSNWLYGHGVGPKDIHVEHTFSIRLGRSALQVRAGKLTKLTSPTAIKEHPDSQCFHPRADLLIRNSEGRNLLIVEVKAPDEILDDDARDQGISYARLLHEGNIAPFVVLTNGRETKIFDSITKEQIEGETIPPEHPYVRAGFRISADDLALRAEALEILISLSPDNLIAFCEAQSSFRMSPLKSADINSNKKYIPSLYVEREEAKDKLERLLEEHRVVVIVGPPQVGKTNFICHLVDERLAQGKPCLFYPAIRVRQSLLHEISEDFEWVLGDNNLSNQIVFNKLRKVLRRSGKRLILFIDGWNEANIKLAQDIDYDCERLKCDEIQIVISLTNVAASRLLGGCGGNPSFIAQEASISRGAAKRIEINPNVELPDWSAVTIKKYSQTEMDEAYSKYAQAYGVTVPDSHKKVAEPYALGIAMKLYQGSTLPDDLDEPELLKGILEDKAARAIGIEHYNLRMCLSTLAKEMLFNESPVRLERAANLWNIPIVEKLPSGFFEAALLAEVSNQEDLPSIDFYYGKERDFVIAYWVQNWLFKLQSKIDISDEFSFAARSKVGVDALRWFFKQPTHIEKLQSEDGSLPVYADPLIMRILLSSLTDIANRQQDRGQTPWLDYAVRQAKEGTDSLVRIEAGRLVASLADHTDIEVALSEISLLEDFIIGMLSANEDYPLERADVGGEILSALEKLHMHSADPEEEFGGSEITGVLERLMTHPSRVIREGAASCLGYVAPGVFLQKLSKEVISSTLTPSSSRLEEYVHGVELAVGQLSERYYGSMCPGALNFLRDEPEQLLAEYEQWSQVLEPVIAVFQSGKTVKRLIELLDDLRKALEESDLSEQLVDEGFSRPSLDLRTIPLPFEDVD
jgi:Type I restriction enzyme R protein N terminus (HSDR_N)